MYNMLEIVSSVQEIKQNKGDGRYRVRSVPVVNKVSGVDLIERVTFGQRQEHRNGVKITF